jgi:hypothetical protein
MDTGEHHRSDCDFCCDRILFFDRHPQRNEGKGGCKEMKEVLGVGEAFGLALQVYLLGFVIALAMACLIKMLMVILNREKKSKISKTEAEVSGVRKAGGEGAA